MNYLILEILLVKLLGLLSLCLAIYGLLSGRVYGRSWEKYWGGWIYKENNPYIYGAYIFMYFVIAISAFLCSILI
ncbi:MAG: hypothetical protein UU95_C0004G0008 [Parcubacteria group bacterium GW2011_GWC2_42_12]|uniref:Immunity protein 17 n=1 Tax=Candidatus Falkowbacteria bacterium GW2011_GWA2_41_14 TaxID=1618635 RepID=A0A0G0X4R6_9BACT|nr:MAG: hypothetical protein UU43_C0003G0008 [Candidatus Falkowbacteria bacterium GW2011_GWA2_41_14]KKS35125.1 MAG: hypothetical protein UU95_C0004G0008 [Parcubacteria group bacterium GW2011_GWC2_42_12]